MRSLFYVVCLSFLVFASEKLFADGGVYQFTHDDISFINFPENDIDAIIDRNDWNQHSYFESNILMQTSPLWLKIKGKRLFSSKIFFALRNPLVDFVSIYDKNPRKPRNSLRG